MEPGASLDAAMAASIGALLKVAKVAIISGSCWPRLERQLLVPALARSKHLKNLSLLPSFGREFYQYESGWKPRYSESFSREEKDPILKSLQEARASSTPAMAKGWRKVTEYCGSQISFPALGHEAPLEETLSWDLDLGKPNAMKASLEQRVPDFSVRLDGNPSMGVGRAGVDKADGIRRLHRTLGIAIDQMFFVGDSLLPAKSDYPTEDAGVLSIRVRHPEKAKGVIEAIIATLDGG